MILVANTPLYRYTFAPSQPPSTWSPGFKNSEYVYGEKCKNEVGAYFFYLNEDTARSGASQSARMERGLSATSPCFLTRCHLLENVELLNLCCSGLSEVTLDYLYKAGIDVLTTEYHLHNGTPFQEIRKLYNSKPNCHNISSADDIDRFAENVRTWTDCVRDFFRIRRGEKSYSQLAQLLTDFDNGEVFKDKLMSMDYEGYIFDEEQSSPTICLFESHKLSQPEHLIIEL